MSQRSSMTLAALLALPVLAGCYQARISGTDLWFMDVAPEAAPDPGVQEIPVTDAEPETAGETVGDVELDVPAEGTTDTLPDTDRLTGSPCETDDQCYTLTCLTTEFLQLMNPNLQVPGGMCSMIGCSLDDECGTGGKCADASELADGFPMICVQQCATDADCGREGYGCPNLGVKDMDGNPLQGCLPLSMVELLLCDNGKCSTEPKDPYCPATCPQ